MGELASLLIIGLLIRLPSSSFSLGLSEDDYHLGKFGRSDIRGPGPVVVPTQGQPWPKPQLQRNFGDTFLILRPAIFRFQMGGHTCDILEDALKRYYSIIILANNLDIHSKNGFLHNHNTTINGKGNSTRHSYSWKTQKGFSGYLDILNIHLMAPCEDWPNEEMDESYEVKINSPDYPGEGILIAPSNWGILRALETFSQLLVPTEDATALSMRSTLIVDFPRFPYRSVLLDTARHFISKKVLYANLDLMAMNKMNIFHWHIVDDESFPYQSKAFPALSVKGAYRQYTHEYTRQDVQDIIQYARVRGIRVIPEFDSPGHTQSWGIGQPGLLTPCYNKTTGFPLGTYGPIDPSKDSTYDFLREFFQEVATTFPDKYIHLGGDEVYKECWESNPGIVKFMKSMNYSSDFARLEGFYIEKLAEIVKGFPQNKSVIVWQEVFDNEKGADLDRSTIVHVWKGGSEWEELANVTSKGYAAILSACWYLDNISYGSDWKNYYVCDPTDFNGTVVQKGLVMGGGPALWGEMVDSTNLLTRLWPRASAPAERLWSNVKVNDTKEAAPRLEEHRCRLLRRGFQVQPPNGAGFCNVDWNQD